MVAFSWPCSHWQGPKASAFRDKAQEEKEAATLGSAG
jgi:hypothetical protein